MKMIVAVDNNWGIGKDNALLYSLPDDMKHFRLTTYGHVIVAGRKTFESFPGGKPLKGRTNLVLTTRGPIEGALCFPDIPSLLSKLDEFYDSEVFVCGGESVYRALLPYCNEAIVTKIRAQKEADAFFPNLDEDPQWIVVSESPLAVCNRYIYNIVTYRRV